MLPVYESSLDEMGNLLRAIDLKVPSPVPVRFTGGFVYRYSERTVRQAIVLRLAGVLSALNASLVLIKEGCVQEQAAIHRMVDEWNEDIVLLTGAELFGREPIHDQFLESFFAEEHTDTQRLVETRVKRNLVPRRKVRAYIARKFEADNDPHRGIEVSETIGNMYSGFVHGAAQHILNIYLGDPPAFQIRGLKGTPRMREHLFDTWNYFYRSLLSFAYAAAAFQDEQVLNAAKAQIAHFESATRRQPSGRASAT